MKIMFAALMLSTALPAFAQTIVVPAAQATAEGNSASSDVFGRINVARVQQVYSASEFGAAPVLLTGVTFRTNGVATGNLFEGAGNAFTRTFRGAFSLSTTARAVDGLANTFGANIGSDVVNVIPDSMITFSSAAGSTNGTRNFDITFTFANAFLYNPLAGNLLLDVSNISGGNVTSSNGTPFDAQNSAGDGISSLYRVNSTSDTATGTLSTRGFVTQFQTAAVPEPASWAMMIGGFGLIGGAMRRRAVRTLATA